LAGCGTFDKGKLDARVASQIVVSKIDPPVGCTYLGAVKGKTPLGELSDAHADVLRNAALNGGNYVAVDVVERPLLLGLGGYEVHGRLFACPQTSTPILATGAPITGVPMNGPPMNGAPMAPMAATPLAPPAPPAAPVGARACDPDCAQGFTCQLGACIAVPAPQAARPAN
jgi:hypothetical protein